MNIAILGHGVVGGGVYALLADGSLGIRVRRVLELRPIEGLEGIQTDNIGDILSDPEIDCVVEAMGGVHPALSYVTAALRAGKHAVTSNKELISHGLAPLLSGAGEHRVQLRFSASVGGGVPWLHNLLRVRRADTLLSVYGIVNGTTNYILDAMHHGLSFDGALKEAQRLGYAESDASADLLGLDAGRKCAISAALAFDAIVEVDDVLTLGITNVRQADVEAFAARGLTVKLLMNAARTAGGLCAYVEPALLGPDALAAHTPTNHNCISLCGENTGLLSFFGQGAGRFPTAENIVQDLLDIRAQTSPPYRQLLSLPVENGAERHPYYIRTALADRVRELAAEPLGPGVITRPMAVDALHALAAEILRDDPEAFFAGLPEY